MITKVKRTLIWLALIIAVLFAWNAYSGYRFQQAHRKRVVMTA